MYLVMLITCSVAITLNWEQKGLIIICHLCNTGDSFIDLQYMYRIGRSTIGGIIHETCQALIIELQPEYLKV